MKKIIAASAATVLALSLAACGSSEQDEHGMSDTQAKSLCLTMAQDAVPGDEAEWQNSYDVLTDQIPGGWWVQGEVQSPNAVGGKVPSVYSCRIVWDEAAQDHVVNFDGVQART